MLEDDWGSLDFMSSFVGEYKLPKFNTRHFKGPCVSFIQPNPANISTTNIKDGVGCMC